VRVLALLGLVCVIAVVAIVLWWLPPPEAPPYPKELETYLFVDRKTPGGGYRLLPTPDIDTGDVVVRGLFERAIEWPENQSRQLALALARDRDWPWLVPAVGEALLQEEGGLALRDVPEYLAAHPDMRPYFERGLQWGTGRVLIDAITGAGRMRLDGVVPHLVLLARSDDEEVRRAAGEALARIGTREAYEPLVESYFAPQRESVNARHTTEWISQADEAVVDLVLERYAAARERSSDRHHAYPLLRATRSKKALERLRDDGLESEWGRARYYAHVAMVDLGDLEALRRLARDADSPHQAPAAWGLAVLGEEDEDVVALLKAEVEKEVRAGTSQLFATPGGDHGLVIPWGAPVECHLETIAGVRTDTDLFAWLESLLEVPSRIAVEHIHVRILQALAIRSPEHAERRLREALEAFDPSVDDPRDPALLRTLDGIRLLGSPSPETIARLDALLDELPRDSRRAASAAHSIRTILEGPPPARAAEIASWNEHLRLGYRKLFTVYRRRGGTGLSFEEAEALAYDAVRGGAGS
jgi:hypothetical protein